MIQVVKDEAINYSSFIYEITGTVKRRMGDGYSLQIFKVTKNNSLELDSLVLLRDGKNFAPNIYLQPYYEAYMEGTSIDELAKRLCSIYQSCTVPIVDDKFSYSFGDRKDGIIYRLVNYEKNRTMLGKIPHIKYLDLAITFHCLVRDDEEGIGTIRITNEHLAGWNTSLQEIHALAIHNTQRVLPSSIRSMDEVIKGMLQEEYISNEDNISEELDQFLTDSEHLNKNKMYILSNNKGINGAACILYDKVLMDFANRINSDYFILPSSIHELILVPYDETIKKETLSAMVQDVNRTQVAIDEVLSDRVYFFSRENNAIIM